MEGVSWYKLVVYIQLSAKRWAYFCKSIAIEMGGVSRYFSEVLGSGVDLTLPIKVTLVPEKSTDLSLPRPSNPRFFLFAFFVFRFPLLWCAFFVSFPKDSRGSAKRKTLAFFGVSLAFFKQAIGNASLFTKFLFTIFVSLNPPSQQSDGFPLEFLLEGPQTELRTLSQNCEQTLQKLQTNQTELWTNGRFWSKGWRVRVASENRDRNRRDVASLGALTSRTLLRSPPS